MSSCDNDQLLLSQERETNWSCRIDFLGSDGMRIGTAETAKHHFSRGQGVDRFSVFATFSIPDMPIGEYKLNATLLLNAQVSGAPVLSCGWTPNTHTHTHTHIYRSVGKWVRR